MARAYRLRRLAAPTRGLREGVIFFLLGQVAFLLGLGLSFRDWIRPLLSTLSEWVRDGIGQFVPARDVPTATHYLAGLSLLLGAWLTYRGVRAMVSHVVETLNPAMKGGKVDRYLRRMQLAQGPRIVALGGGTGLSTLLRGLKMETSNVTAVVTVTDDGGSSGLLIRDKNLIPPGDIRNCLVALADAEKAMTDLFQHRFKDSGALSGHSMGNLLIAALTDQAGGDFDRAVEIASDVLAIRGRVVPSTLAHVRLGAELDAGDLVYGETRIAAQDRPIRRLFLDPGEVRAHQAALEAIRTADLICIGPGSVYTSLIPNLLVPGIAEAIIASPAPKVYVCNVMTQPGESAGFSASRHVLALQECVGKRVFDYVLVNTADPSETALARYRESGQHMVEADVDQIRKLGYRALPGNYVSETDVVRHDPAKVTQRLMKLLQG